MPEVKNAGYFIDILAAYAASGASRPFYAAPCVPDPRPGGYPCETSVKVPCFQNVQSVWQPFVLGSRHIIPDISEQAF